MFESNLCTDSESNILGRGIPDQDIASCGFKYDSTIPLRNLGMCYGGLFIVCFSSILSYIHMFTPFLHYIELVKYLSTNLGFKLDCVT